jgi:hypothetical protein
VDVVGTVFRKAYLVANLVLFVSFSKLQILNCSNQNSFTEKLKGEARNVRKVSCALVLPLNLDASIQIQSSLFLHLAPPTSVDPFCKGGGEVGRSE